MNKYISFLVALIISCVITGYFLPWWTIVIPSALLAYYFSISGIKAFLTGLISIFFLWYVLTQYLTWSSSSKILEMVGNIFLHSSTQQLSVIAGLVGGIAAGLACWAGSSIRQYFR